MSEEAYLFYFFEKSEKRFFPSYDKTGAFSLVRTIKPSFSRDPTL
jgi:hypothetical protein